MIFANPRRLISESSAADFLDPTVSDEVKNTIDDLEDTLTNNVEEIDDADKTTNGGIPVTTESVPIMRVSNPSRYPRGIKYLVSLENVIAIKEAEGEAAAAEKMDEPGATPTPEEAEKEEPNAVDIVKDIADKNGVDEDQVAVVISSESCRFFAETALLEAKCGKKSGKGKKKLKKTAKTVKELKGKVAMVKA